MCNIAGYIGEKRAAPVLIEMMKKQEGFAGGFYSGIATIHEGKLHYAKLTGDTERLVNFTKAANLPGNTGIIHSRSKSGGGDSWAHPFIGYREGRECEAYVANGYMSNFAISDKEYGAIVEKLIKDGLTFTSRVVSGKESYFSLYDGTTVHMSDVMCQLITRNISGGKTPDEAMEDAFCKMPNEIVGLLLSLADPEKIFWARINRPMMLSFANHGAYLATTAIAFPEDAGKVVALPVNSSGFVKNKEFFASPFEKPRVTVGEINDATILKAEELIRRELKEEKTFKEIEKLIKPLFKDEECAPNSLLGYEVLRSLYKNGEIEFKKEMTEGVADGIFAPQIKISKV